MPQKIFATSEVILETSSELSIEADGVVVRLVSLEEGPGSSVKTKHYYLLTKPLVMHLSMFCPTSPMRENEGLNQGIILKFCPQGRGISLAHTKLLFSLLDSSLDSFVTVEGIDI